MRTIRHTRLRRTISRKRTLHALMRSLPAADDMFRKCIDLKTLQDATDRYLNGRESRDCKFQFLCQSADKLAIAGFPEHAALMMEAAGKYMLNTAQDGREDREWQEGYEQASSYWLQAGNPEESENSTLMAAGKALGLKLQLPMFEDQSGGRHVMPLWTVAMNLAEAGKYEEAAEAYERIAEEMELFKDNYGLAVICIQAARMYAYLDRWNDVVPRLEHTISLFDQHTSLINNRRLQFTAHFMVGVAYLHTEPEADLNKAVERLERAWKLWKTYGEETEADDDDRRRLTRLLGVANLGRGEGYMEAWHERTNEHALRFAQLSFETAIAYFQMTNPLPIAELGHTYSVLSVACWLQGDRVTAASYQEQAKLYGVDPEELSLSIIMSRGSARRFTR